MKQYRKGAVPNAIFVKKLSKNILMGTIVMIISLALGMYGYYYFEGMSIADAYVNAAMILSGMGPVSPLQTTAGKIFAGSYAIFSGVIFLVVIAVVFGPVIHRVIHKFHMQEH